MTTLKGIKGFRVKTLSSDTVASQASGGTWASGGSMNTGRTELGGAGVQTASIAMGGKTPGVDYNAIVEIYDGSSWTETGDLNTARKMGGGNGAGTTTAALAFGGRKSPSDTNTGETESWNGSAWTEVNDLNTARGQLAGSGATYTAAIAAGGGTPSATAVTETWNGSSWTEVNDLNNSRRNVSMSGTTTNAIAGGGEDGPKDRIESWDGSSWTEVAEANTSRHAASMSCNGSNTDTLFFGGTTPPYTTKNEFWNGTTWTEVNDLATAKGYAAGTGTSASAFSFGGEPGSIATTEEFVSPSTFSKQNLGQVYFNSTTNTFKVTKQDFPAGTFASGGNLNTARRQQGTFGAYNDAIVAGTLTYGANVENYNGTAWTEINDVPAGASSSGGSGTTASSGAIFMGYNTSTSVTNATYEFDGTNWTAGGNANTARGAGGGTGSSANDAIYVGGTNAAAPQTIYANVETYNGSSWTETTDIAEARQLNALVGTSTSALMIGGSPAPSPTQTQSWNGTSWTNIGALPTNIYGNAGFGTSTVAIAFGGLPPGTDTNANMRSAMFYNGTSWSDVAEMATSRASANGAGTNASATNGLAFGGYNPLNNPPSYDLDANKTEEWTVDVANQTITLG